MHCLDEALASFNVERQAYYSGTFVGNHVHRALKISLKQNQTHCFFVVTEDENVHILCSAIESLASRVCLNLLPDATKVLNKFQMPFKLFSSCHKIYNGKKVNDDNITELGNACF